MGGMLLKYFTQYNGVFETVNLIKFSSILQFHGVVEFFNVFVLFVSQNIIFQGGIELVGRKKLTIFRFNFEGIIPGDHFIRYGTLSRRQIVQHPFLFFFGARKKFLC